VQLSKPDIMKVIAFSALCVDYYPECKISRPGGNSLNFAVHAKKFEDTRVAVAGYLGEDDEAKQIMKLLKDKDIDTKLLYTMKGRTASNKLYNTPDGERYSKPGDWKNGVYNNFEFSESDFSAIFNYELIAIPYSDKNLEEVIKRNKAGKPVVVDFLHYDDAESISRFLSFIEIAFVSAQKKNLAMLKSLAKEKNKLIVATLGAGGSIAFHGDKEYFQPALGVEKIVDTTGCGDAYQAAFSMNYFRNGNIEEAMLNGARVAAEVLLHYGGVK